MNKTKIEWAEAVWNPITGCTPVSEGCRNCYARRMSKRFAGRFGYDKKDPFRLTFHSQRIKEPLKWDQPRRIFVCSMGDLFHKDVKIFWLREVIETIVRCPKHIFILLTKRPENIAASMSLLGYKNQPWMPDNVWLGVTIESNDYWWRFDDYLEKFPARVKFISHEPLLGPIDYRNGIMPNWVIVGGESGPNASPMHPDWVRSIRDHCINAGVPFLFKQWGAWLPGDRFFYDVASKRQQKNFVKLIDGYSFRKFGKKKTGRILDGKIWDQYPED